MYSKQLKTFVTVVVYLLFSITTHITGQRIYVNVHVGSMYYQGDLAPQPIKLSFGPSNIAYGTSVGTEFFNWFGLSTRILHGSISGDDAYARDPQRKVRNLSFVSPITQFSLLTHFKINYFLKGLNKYKIRLYTTAGAGITLFDPKANYNNELIRLQPLGTEGQFLPNSNKEPYSLNTLTRVVGGTIEFDIAKKISLGLEVTTNRTYTDYLDDVSGSYVNYNEFVAAGQTLAGTLSNRTGEYLGTNPVIVNTGTLRGNSIKKDWYTYFGMHIKYSFGPEIVPIAVPVISAAIPLVDSTQNSQPTALNGTCEFDTKLIALPENLDSTSTLVLVIDDKKGKVVVSNDTLCFTDVCPYFQSAVTSNKTIYIASTETTLASQTLALKTALQTCIDHLKREKTMEIYSKSWEEINNIQKEAVMRLLDVKVVEVIK
ncbi:MAG: DUF6089 family protein [Saprospiraceae bacterium]